MAVGSCHAPPGTIPALAGSLALWGPVLHRSNPNVSPMNSWVRWHDATLFVKGGDEFIRVSTSVPKPDGSGRAIGTVLAGPALESIKAGKGHYGEVPILGTPYMTGYEPIKDGSGATIGVYYVGYKK